MSVVDNYPTPRKICDSGYLNAKIISIITMTANTFTEDINAAHVFGMNGHVVKPVDVKVLYQIIAKFLELHT